MTRKFVPGQSAKVVAVRTDATGYPMWVLTTYSFSASASDPDGDALTCSWDFGNGSGSGSSSASVIYDNAVTRNVVAVLTVRDSKGASTSANVTVTSATLAGVFVGDFFGAPMTLDLTQYVGGTWDAPLLGLSGAVGPTGEPGRIQANGQFELRFKVLQGSFIDFHYRGSMDPTGQRLTGTLHGSGFAGQYMQFDKR